MVGSVDGALKRFGSHERKHQRVAVNFEKQVLDAILRLAKREKTTPADLVRRVMTARVMMEFPVEFGIINQTSEVQPA